MRPSPLLLVLPLVSCAGGTAVRTGEMGAQAHRRAAADERAAAREHVSQWDAGARMPAVTPELLADEVILDSAIWFDPRGWHLDEAQRHAARARAHEDAAQELEAFEARACADVPDESRGLCYVLGPVSELRDVEGGVSIRFAEGADLAAVAAHLRCHYAWARARGFDEAAVCPLDVPDVRFEVEGASILVLGDDARTVEAIRRRARVQATPAWRR